MQEKGKGMPMDKVEYEKLRARCIDKYRILYKDSLVFDACEVPKETRIVLQDDEVYLMKTKALKAELFATQLELIDSVLLGNYRGSSDTDASSTVLKAIEMRQKILLEDLNVTKDESNALNVTFVAMDRDAFESLSTVEVGEGGNSNSLGADFGVSEETDSFESRMKSDVKARLDRGAGNGDIG